MRERGEEREEWGGNNDGGMWERNVYCLVGFDFMWFWKWMIGGRKIKCWRGLWEGKWW